MDWKDTSRDKMGAVGCAEASITVKTELFLGPDEDVRTNWNRTSCLSRRIRFATKIQRHVGNVSTPSCCTFFAHFPRCSFLLIAVYFYLRRFSFSFLFCLLEKSSLLRYKLEFLF